MSNEDPSSDENTTVERLPSLFEAMEMVRRLNQLSTVQYPDLHPSLTQFQSKLFDVYLNQNVSTQKTIHDFFKPV